MSTALYRRYRPETFAEVIGQEHVTEPLITALTNNRVNHAYLFSGPRGCGKTTSARILARCLNCAQGPTPTPCGVCDSCRELSRDGGGSLDVIEMDAASHGGVDHARDLRERATLAPVRDRYKIFIIDEAHMVTREGFNALLKIVEEPPEHIKFIFATTEPNKVLGTIRSRTHHYPFRLVPPEVLLPYLEKLCGEENVPVESGVLQLVIRAGGGSVRDSLSILDQLIAGANTESGISYDRAVALLGYTHAQLLDNVIDAFSTQDAPSLFEAVSRVVATGQDPRRFVEDLLERLRDLIVVQAVPQNAAQILQGVPADQIERLKAQAQAFTTAQLTGAASTVNEVLNSMTGATNPQLQLELLCARLLVPAEDTTGLIARLESLEQRIAAGGTGSSPAAPRGAVPSPNRAMAPGQNSTGRAAGSADQQANSPSGTNPQPATPQAPVHTGPVFSSPTPGDEQPQPSTSHDGAGTAGSAPSHGQHQQQTTHTPQPPRPMQAQGDQGTAHRTAGASQQRQTARNGEGASDPLLSVRGNWRVIVGRVSDRSVTEQLLRLEPVRYTNGELYVRADMPTLRAVKASVTELSERVSDFLRVKVRVRAEVAKKTPRDDVKPAGNQTGNSPAAPSSQGAVPSATPTSTDTSAIADGPRGGEDAWRRHGQPVQPQGSGQDQPAATSVDDPLSAWQVAPIPQEDPASPTPEPENPKEPGAAEGHPKNTGNTAPNRAAHTQTPTTAASTSTRGEETQTPAKGTTPQQAAQGASQSFAESAYADSPAEYPAPNDHDVPPEDPYFPPAPDPDVHGAGAHSAGDAAVPPLSGPFEEQGPQEPAETPPEDTGQEPQQPFGERDSFASSTPAGVHTEKAGESQNSTAEEEEKEEAFGSVSTPEPGQDWAPVGAETLPGGAASEPSEDETTSGQPSEPEHSTAPASKSVFAAAFEEEENFETSADDEQVESSVHVGLKAVEKILGGKLIDETPL